MVEIKALGETQTGTGDACGAFCLAAIASGMGIIPGQQNSTKTIEYEPNNIKIKGTLHLDKKANEIAKEMYKVTGNLLQDETDLTKTKYDYTNAQHKDKRALIINKNSVSGLALVASEIGMTVTVNATKGCLISGMSIYDDEKKLLDTIKRVNFNENVNAYIPPNANQAQIVCVHEPNLGMPEGSFTHWIAVDSDKELYDPRTDEPKEKDEISKKIHQFSDSNDMKLKNGEYEFSGLWITLSK
ncbi:MAG: hypothetical protein AB4368_17430 [Xenococcaceae cyanobacterium]